MATVPNPTPPTIEEAVALLGALATEERLSASFRNPQKVAGLKSTFFRVHEDVFFRNQRPRFFLLQTGAKSLSGAAGLLAIRVDNQQTDTGSMIRQASGEVGFQTGRFSWFSSRR